MSTTDTGVTTEIAVTFVIERADHSQWPVRFNRLPEEELEAADRDAYGRWFRTEHDVAGEDGLWLARVTWRDLLTIHLRGRGWSDNGPAPDRGENGPGLQLPSGIWVMLSDVDIAETVLVDEWGDE